MRWRGQEGFTLPELLVVVAILPVVLLALLSALNTTTKLAPRSIEYANAVQEAGNGLSRAIQQIRQSTRVIATTPNSLTFVTSSGGVDSQVNISCGVTSTFTAPDGSALRRCVRTSAPLTGSLPSPSTGAVLVDRLVNGTIADPVFEFSPSPIAPTYVRLLVKVPPRGAGRQGTRSTPIIIDDGTLLRNSTVGS
ncbi:MAG: type II secretion system protein [Solirubrobacteraceae bacterium]